MPNSSNRTGCNLNVVEERNPAWYHRTTPTRKALPDDTPADLAHCNGMVRTNLDLRWEEACETGDADTGRHSRSFAFQSLSCLALIQQLHYGIPHGHPTFVRKTLRIDNRLVVTRHSKFETVEHVPTRLPHCGNRQTDMFVQFGNR